MDTYMDVTNFEMTGEKETIKDFFVISADCHVNEKVKMLGLNSAKLFNIEVPAKYR